MRPFQVFLLFIFSFLAIADCCQLGDYNCVEVQGISILENKSSIEIEETTCHCENYCFGNPVLENVHIYKLSYSSFIKNVSYPDEDEAIEKFLPFLIVRPPIVAA